jgi:hypothetical protein
MEDGMSNLSRRSLVTSAAALPVLAVPAAASPSCTLPPDLIERFLRVRAWFLENRARESLWSDEIDKRFYAATGVTSKQWRDMLDGDETRHEELQVLRHKVYEEVEGGVSDEECTALCNERWSVAKAMLNHEPQTIVDLAWQAEAWLVADLELFGHYGNALLGTMFRNIRMLGALPQPDDPFGALTIVASDEEAVQS